MHQDRPTQVQFEAEDSAERIVRALLLCNFLKQFMEEQLDLSAVLNLKITRIASHSLAKICPGLAVLVFGHKYCISIDQSRAD